MRFRVIRAIAATAVAGAVALSATSAAHASDGAYFANPGFESGLTDWSQFSTPHGDAYSINNGSRFPARTGQWKAELGGEGRLGLIRISQQVTIPANTHVAVRFWLWVVPPRGYGHGFRELTVEVTGQDGISHQLATRTNKDGTDGYQRVKLDLPSRFYTPHPQRVTVTFFAIEDAANAWPFLVDDVHLEYFILVDPKWPRILSRFTDGG